jgi:hypothetical protein
MRALTSLPLFLSLLSFLFSSTALAQPRHLYLTWDNEDTAHTQTVVFHTDGKASEPRVEVLLNGPSAQATVLSASTVQLGSGQRRVHRVTLKNLQPATSYRFRAGDNRFGLSPWRTFRTLPADDSSLRIATGGDMYRHPETVQLLKAAASYKPHVALIGGDIAYADGDLTRIGFWDDWFDNWDEFMNPADGPMVGLICALGNHELRGHFDGSKKDAPFYFAFFPQGGESYFARRLSGQAEVVVLDTSHATHPKAQAGFLEDTLRSMQERQVPYRLALYHVALYPTHRSYEDEYSRRGRQFWVPLFDRFGLTAGLENHDHTFKRTHPLRGGKVVPRGTVYLGDGCWGRTPRAVKGQRWYLAKASSTYHVWMLTTRPDGLLCQAVGLDGKVFDQVTLKPATSPPKN